MLEGKLHNMNVLPPWVYVGFFRRHDARPQGSAFYLLGLTLGVSLPGLIKGQPQIWILDKQTKEIRLGSPNKSAAFSYYYSSQLPDGSYDNSIEESFSKPRK